MEGRSLEARTPRISLWRLAPIVLVAAAGIVLSLVAYEQVRRTQYERQVSAFDRIAEDWMQQFRYRVHSSLEHVDILERFFAASDDVTRSDFRTFARAAARRHDTVQGLAWIPRVKADLRQQVESAAQQEVPGFRITERNAAARFVPAGRRPVYYPAYYLEPLDRNQLALGFDLGSEPERRRTLEHARDTGSLVASHRIRLIQGDFGILAFRPVYRKGAALETQRARRANLEGFVLGLFRIADLVRVSVPSVAVGQGGMELHVFDRYASEQRQLLYTSGETEATAEELQAAPLRYAGTIKVADREWLVLITPRGGMIDTSAFNEPLLSLLVGLGLTFLLSAYLAFSHRQHARVERLVAERTHDLRIATRRTEDRERRIRAIHDTVLDGIITIDEFGTIEDINPAAERIFGYAPGELTGSNLRVLLPLPEQSAHNGYIGRYMETGEPHVIGSAGREVSGLRKDGSTFPMELRVSELRLDDRLRFTGVLRDVTERHRAQEALQQSEQRFKDIAQAASDWIWETDAELRFRYLSERFQDTTGLSAVQCLGSSCSELVNSADDSGQWANALNARQPFRDFEHNYQDEGGQARVCRMSGQPYYDAQGIFLGYRGTGTDVTHLRRAEQALRATEERLRAVVTNAPIVVFAVDRDGVFTLSEGRGLEALGRQPGEVVGRTIYDVYRDVPEIQESIRRALNGESFSVEVPLDRLTFEAYYGPLRDGHDEVAGVLGVAFDITERKRAEAMKSEFVSTVSHELRTPLASIVGYVDLILDEDVGPVTDEQREFLQVVSQNALRLTQLVSDLLDIEKLETGRTTMERDPLDLFDVVFAVEHTFSILAKNKGLELTLEAAPGLDVLGDKDRLNQVFGNLLSNAVKYTKAGRIHVDARKTGGMVQVSISDTGIGMDAETRARLFYRFFRANDEYTRAAGGTGLGLAITKAIVIQHGGSIDVESTPGAGSTFTVSLPDAGAVAGSRRTGETSHPAAARNVLCALQDRALARDLASRLEAAGIVCFPAGAPEKWLAAFRESNPGMVILDGSQGDGREHKAASNLQAEAAAAGVPVVFIAEPDSQHEVLQLGATAFLGLPVTAEEIMAYLLGLASGTPDPVLIVDDDVDFADVLQRMLAKRGIASDKAHDGEGALALCRRSRYAVIVLDYHLPQESGLDLLRRLKDELQVPAAVILISGSTLDRAVEEEALSLGSLRFLNKKVGVADIANVIQQHLGGNESDDRAADRAG